MPNIDRYGNRSGSENLITSKQHLQNSNANKKDTGNVYDRTKPTPFLAVADETQPKQLSGALRHYLTLQRQAEYGKEQCRGNLDNLEETKVAEPKSNLSEENEKINDKEDLSKKVKSFPASVKERPYSFAENVISKDIIQGNAVSK